MGYTFVPMMAGVYELLARTVVAFTLPAFIGYLGICIACLLYTSIIIF